MAFFFQDVLAGPIVRRVEPRLVSVWVALKKSGKVKLKVWEGLQSAATSATPVGEVEVDTISIGANLHLALPVLETFSHPGHLKNDTLYSYDIQLREPSETSANGMQALELLKKHSANGVTLHEPLGYEDGMLPGFHLPPSNINNLKLLETSCRLPHSNIDDALALMDDVFTNDKTGQKVYQSAALRPHQLFLTGDQIYADEVSPMYLGLLNKVGNQLLSGSPNVVIERLPFEHQGQVYDVPLTCGLFPPGRRQRLTFQKAGMTSGCGGSHLVGFSEYAAMYLMAWSTIPWPADFFQTQLNDRWNRVQGFRASWQGLLTFFESQKENLTGDQQKMIQEKIDYFFSWRLLPDEWRVIDHYLTTADKAEEWGTEDCANIPVGNHPNTVDGVPNPDTDPTALPHAGTLPSEVKRALAKSLTPSWYAGNREMGFGERQDKELYSDNALSHLRGLQKYFAGLPKVRRVLANVATYMMFDDHEVTDDWNLFHEWVHKVHNSRLGVTIVRNGLLAYGLFQGWGNDPLYFAGRQPGEPEVVDTPATEMLDDATRLFLDDTGQPKPGPDAAPVVRLHDLFNLKSDLNNPTPVEERVRWHYRVGGHGYEVLSLDIRTFRGFKGPRVAPQLMTFAAIQNQIPEDPVYSYGTPPANEGITFVISGMPVLGFPPVVNFVQPLVNLIDDIKPKPNPPFVKAKEDYEVGIFAHEPEPWAFQEDAWEALLARFANYRRVVIFSGENHYSYSMKLDYWRYHTDGTPADSARFLQFTSSAAKNFPGKGTSIIFHNGFAGRLADIMGQPQERMGWDTTGQSEPPLVAPPGKPFNRLVQLRVQGSPAIVPLTGLPEGTRRLYDPQWSWRGDLVRETRPDNQRFQGVTFPEFVEPAEPGEIDLAFVNQLVQRHLWQSVRGPSRVITFPSGFGMVTVNMTAPEPEISYEVHYVLRELFDKKARPYNRYTVPLLVTEQPPVMPEMLEGVLA
jgi:hypothetical protein